MAPLRTLLQEEVHIEHADNAQVWAGNRVLSRLLKKESETSTLKDNVYDHGEVRLSILRRR